MTHTPRKRSASSAFPRGARVDALLVAWDIDQTLLTVGAAGLDAMDTAVRRALDRAVAHEVRFGGKTDPRIAGEILVAAEVPAPHDGRVADILGHLEHVFAERAELVAEQGRVLPGVWEALRRLRDLGAVQTVLTGNIRPNAALKLAAFGLEKYVDENVGAYGSDDVDREKLLPCVWDRVEHAYGHRPSPSRTWVVGDTEHDYACAEASGAHCLLVGTGRTPVEELARLGADLVLPDLSDVDRVVATLLDDG